MPTFTVKEIRATKPWKSPDGTRERVYYDVLVNERDGNVNLGRNPGNPVEIGMTLDGDLEADGRGGWKFKATRNGFGSGRPRDPQESARIQRQHAQEMALRYAAIKAKTDLKLDDDFRKVIDWFDADTKAATP